MFAGLLVERLKYRVVIFELSKASLASPFLPHSKPLRPNLIPTSKPLFRVWEVTARNV